MTFLPIVERELRVAARKPLTWWSRLAAAAIGLLIGAWVLAMPWIDSARIGQSLFYPLSVFVYFYSLLGGVWATADTLSEEKREGTLGLLFLTDLRGYDIVLGKLAATSLHVFYGLLAVFPVMAIPLLAGGVTLAEFSRVVLVALNNLLFSLAAGLLASALCREERMANVLAIAILIFSCIILPLAAAWFEDRRPDLALVFLIPAPTYACALAFDSVASAAGAKNFFLESVLTVLALSLVMLASACLIAPRSWQERASASHQRRQQWAQWLRFGFPIRRAWFRRRLLERNPYHWLTARDRLKPAGLWLLFGMVGLIWLGCAIDYSTFEPIPVTRWHPAGFSWKDWAALPLGVVGWIYLWQPFALHREAFDGPVYITVALTLHAILKLWFASEVTRRLCADRRSGALELLLCTPLKVGAIVRGQLISLERHFALPLLFVLALDVVFLLTEKQEELWVAIFVCGMVVLVADLLTLAVVGMWLSLRARNSRRATLAAVVRVMVLPWFLWWLCMTLIVVTIFAEQGFPSSRYMTEWLPLGLWLVISLAVDALFAVPGWANLHGRFRERAAERFTKRRHAALSGGVSP